MSIPIREIRKMSLSDSCVAVFDEKAYGDLAYWDRVCPATASRVRQLIFRIGFCPSLGASRDTYRSGCLSRPINKDYSITYEIVEGTYGFDYQLRFLSLRDVG